MGDMQEIPVPPVQPPPPPPPLPPASTPDRSLLASSNTTPEPPLGSSSTQISTHRDDDARLVELLVYSGGRFANHWAYYLRAPGNDPNGPGTKIHATGDVSNGFIFEVKRDYNPADNDSHGDGVPWKRIPLQWISDEHCRQIYDKNNNGKDDEDDDSRGNTPACGFEYSASKVKPPGASLNPTAAAAAAGSQKKNDEPPGVVVKQRKRPLQRNCQTWIVESADQLVMDGLFEPRVAAYLRAVQQS